MHDIQTKQPSGEIWVDQKMVGGDWNHGILCLSIQLGMSSSQLTHIFQRGRLNHQPVNHDQPL